MVSLDTVTAQLERKSRSGQFLYFLISVLSYFLIFKTPFIFTRRHNPAFYFHIFRCCFSIENVTENKQNIIYPQTRNP